jgi:hypothetical protein
MSTNAGSVVNGKILSHCIYWQKGIRLEYMERVLLATASRSYIDGWMGSSVSTHKWAAAACMLSSI